MSLPNYLAQIKSSGIYRFVWDKSEIAGLPAETLRLVVGYSEKGPFNTPVYITSAAEFKSVYGDISKKLEKRGIFFHRLALQCLEKSPIIVLNLKKFKDEEVQASSFNVSDSEIKQIGTLVENIYDTTRFWKLEPENILSATAAGDNTAGDDKNKKYISIAATDSKESSCSVFIRGYKPNGYDVTINSWYAAQGEEMPDYFVIEGDDETPTRNYGSLLVSDFWAEVFVFRGEFTPSICAAEPLNKYFDITDGKVQLKPFILNAFGEKMDTLTALANDESSNFINSYNGCLLPYFKNQLGAYASLDLAFNLDNGLHKMMMNLNSDLLYDGEIGVESLITTGWTEDYAFGFKLDKTVQDCTLENGEIKYSEYNGLYEPDFIKYNLSSDNLIIIDTEANNTETVYTFAEYTEKTLEDATLKVAWFTNEEDETGIYVYENEIYTDSTNGLEISDNLKIKTQIKFDTLGITAGNRIIVDDNFYTISKVDDYEIVAIDFEGNEKQVKIIDEFKLCNHSASITNTNLKPIYFEGYTYYSDKPEDSSDYAKLKWQQNILSVLRDYQGIRTGLTNRIDLDYRYIVDTFEGLVETELHKELALIAKEKDNAIALLNFPAMKTFKKCQYISFTDEAGKLQTKYIAEGGNKKKNLGLLFTLVSEVNGASYVSYNTPLIFSDGTVKTIVPAAGLVSNNFMEKYQSRQPYYIVAGPTYGRIIASGLVGPEYNFTRADLDILEPMGVNATVYVPRLGTYINSNQTAKQNPVTALSKINVRELVIYLQDEIEALLQDYQWEFNTQYLRDLVKAKADTICERVKNNGGLYNYLNICDESNNTDDVINNEMFVLSTSIEPGMGCGKMVHELTIYKKGGMSSIIK